MPTTKLKLACGLFYSGRELRSIIRCCAPNGMLIVIDGCIGAGKTTVARGLSMHRRAECILENFEANPFLRAFYDDPVEHAVETELAFLLVHYHQLKRNNVAARRAELVSDFHLGKDRLYADLNLAGHEARRIFQELCEFCERETAPVGLLVYLAAPTSLIMERILARKRDFELGIDQEYYARLNRAYDNFFERFPARKLRIPMCEWDFVRDPSLYEKLSTLIDGALGAK